MAQNFTDDCFAPGNAGQTDLQNMENNFQALKTLFSGSSAPANSTSGMPWVRLFPDTSQILFQLRNYANTSWMTGLYEFSGVDFLVPLGCYQNIIAGTGLTGGGWLYNSSYEVTISVASSGIDSAQIKDKAITPSKLSLIGTAPNVVKSTIAGSYTYENAAYIPFTCPTSPSTIAISIGLAQQSTAAAYRAFAYGVVLTTAGSTATSPSATIGDTTHVGVFKTSTVSISATGLTPGSSYMVAVYLRGGTTDTNAFMSGIRAEWA